jgi:hypothetical protein
MAGQDAEAAAGILGAQAVGFLIHNHGQGGHDPQSHAAASASVVSEAFAAVSFLRASSSVPTM